VSKFVGKFRKNQNYNEDYNYESSKRHRNEHAEMKKILARDWQNELSEEYDDEISQSDKL
jgi:hypothetical protein